MDGISLNSVTTRSPYGDKNLAIHIPQHQSSSLRHQGHPQRLQHPHCHRYLNEDPPSGLHGHGDVGDDRVCDGEVEHQVVHVCPAL